MGTAFKPLKFSLDEKADTMHLCGCKLSTSAPFCDGKTCRKLLKGIPLTKTQGEHAEEKPKGRPLW